MKKGLEEFCEATKDCEIENTVCTERNTCECKINFIAQNESQCKPGMNAECEKTEDCAFENAECKIEVVDETSSAKKCHCKEEFIGVKNVCLEIGEKFETLHLIREFLHIFFGRITNFYLFQLKVTMTTKIVSIVNNVNLYWVKKLHVTITNVHVTITSHFITKMENATVSLIQITNIQSNDGRERYWVQTGEIKIG